MNHYGVNLVTKKGKEVKVEEKKRSDRAQKRIGERQKDRVIDTRVSENFPLNMSYCLVVWFRMHFKLNGIYLI